MTYKLNGFMFTAMFAAVGMLAVAGTTFAQTIPGTFVGINDTNTELQEEITRVSDTTGELVGTRFSSTNTACLLYTSPSPRDQRGSRMPSSA